MLSLLVANGKECFDVIQLAKQITWSGSYQQGARKLDVQLISAPYDQSISLPDLSPGNAVQLFSDDRILFSGVIIKRSRQTGGSSITVSCYDRGFYLLKNNGVYQFRSTTPDQIVRRCCKDYGIPVGSLAPCKTRITRNFINVPLYKIMMTAYTLAGKETGEDYMIRFAGNALEVIAMKANDQTLILTGGSNLQSAAMTDSIEQTVTQVIVYDANNRIVQTIKNDELQQTFGILQQAVKQSDGQDAGSTARKLLADRGLQQTVTVENFGNIACVTGNTVVLQEPYTGLFGLFWITADSHVWKDGQYYNKLSLSFRRMMDEQEAGSLPNRTGSNTGNNDVRTKAEYDLTHWKHYVKTVNDHLFSK